MSRDIEEALAFYSNPANLPESSRKSWIDPPFAVGEPCICCRLNGTSGYIHNENCPACEGTGVVKDAAEVPKLLKARDERDA